MRRTRLVSTLVNVLLKMMSFPVASGLSWHVLLLAVNQSLRQAPPPAPLLDQSGKGGRVGQEVLSGFAPDVTLLLLFFFFVFLDRLREVLPAGHSLPIPVPTQQQNFQRLEQNLHSSRLDGSCTDTRLTSCCFVSDPERVALSGPMRRCGSGNLQGFAGAAESPPPRRGELTNRRPSLGAGPIQPSSQRR